MKGEEVNLQEVLTALRGEYHFFIVETMVSVLLANGYGKLPVLVRRSAGRDVVYLKNLTDYLAKPLPDHDYVRDVSTWPEDLAAVEAGTPAPHAKWLVQ